MTSNDVHIEKSFKKRCNMAFILTVVRMSKGRLPWWSDRAPVIGDDRNCSRENSDPIRPKMQIEEQENECSFFALLRVYV